MESATDEDLEIQTQKVLLAAAQHDVTSLRSLLQTHSANVQDGETGFTPLHAAVAALDESGDHSFPEEQREGEVNAAEETIRLLLQNGAIWNDLDSNNETPACIAWRCHLTRLYDIFIEAGLRAELLLNRLDDFERLASASSDADAEEVSEEQVQASGDDDEEGAKCTLPQQRDDDLLEFDNDHGLSNSTYLEGPLAYEGSQLIDEHRNGVMMSWETDIMSRTADSLLSRHGLSCLNIGHGMGIIDSLLQTKNPVSHHIIEAHPDVLKNMQECGWYDKPNVFIHEGTWQDVLPRLATEQLTFDAIFYDTFAEDYKSFKNFFSEHVVTLLKPDGKWSFFNGLGADRQCVYDVYTKVVEIDLFEAGFDIDWTTIQVPDQGHATAQKAIRRRYWALDAYKMPLCTFSD